MSFAISVLMLAVPIFSLQVYDRVLGSGSRDTLLALVLITSAALAALGMLETVRTWVLAENSARRFYERLGGEPAGESMVTIAGARLREVAYVWRD